MTVWKVMFVLLKRIFFRFLSLVFRYVNLLIKGIGQFLNRDVVNN